MASKKDKTTRKMIWFYHISLFIFIIEISFLYRDTLTLLDLTPLISILQNTSAMVFTIMGIWIAYLYPEAVLKIVKSSSAEDIPEEHEDRIKLIVGIVALSAIVMTCLVLIALLHPLLTNSPLYQSFPSVVRAIGLFIIFSLTYAQLFAIYVVIASNVNFLRDIRNIKNKKILHKKLYPELYEVDEE